MIYRILLGLHSWNRWIILILGISLVIAAWKGWLARSDDSGSMKRMSVWFIISVDVQLLLGFVLYFVSPVIGTFLRDPGASMSQGGIRFFAVEHTLMMLIATVVAHVGRVMIKNAEEPAVAHRRGAIAFTIALLIILVSIPWPFISWGRPLFFI